MSNQPPISFRPNQPNPQQYASNFMPQPYMPIPGPYGVQPQPNNFYGNQNQFGNSPQNTNPFAQPNNQFQQDAGAANRPTLFQRSVAGFSQNMNNQHITHLKNV